MVWLLYGYAGFCAGLAGYAGVVAVSAEDQTKRADAYRVLKLVWGTGTGGGVLGELVMVVLKLNSGSW